MSDIGFGLGLLCALGCGAAWIATGYVTIPVTFTVIGAVLLVVAFILCWWFG